MPLQLPVPLWRPQALQLPQPVLPPCPLLPPQAQQARLGPQQAQQRMPPAHRQAPELPRVAAVRASVWIVGWPPARAEWQAQGRAWEAAAHAARHWSLLQLLPLRLLLVWRLEWQPACVPTRLPPLLLLQLLTRVCLHGF